MHARRRLVVRSSVEIARIPVRVGEVTCLPLGILWPFLNIKDWLIGQRDSSVMK